jgi:hypothetical protein
MVECDILVSIVKIMIPCTKLLNHEKNNRLIIYTKNIINKGVTTNFFQNQNYIRNKEGEEKTH